MRLDPVSVGKFNQAIRSALSWFRVNDAHIDDMADLASHYKAPYPVQELCGELSDTLFELSPWKEDNA